MNREPAWFRCYSKLMRVNLQPAPIAVVALMLVAPLASAGDDIGDGTAGSEQLLRTTRRAEIKHVVAEKFPAARDTRLRLAVEIQILPGMHVNANPPTHDWLIPVEVSIGETAGIGVAATFYPEAELIRFSWEEDEPIAVYEETFVIGLELDIAAVTALGDRNLEIVLDYQACNDSMCFAPTQSTFTFPLTVVADGAESVKSKSPLIGQAPFPKG